MKKKGYRKSDIKKYRKLNKEILKNPCALNVLDITYETAFKENIRIPCELFSHILKEKKPELLKYTPFKIVVEKLIRGNNKWLKKTNILGIYNNETNVLTFRVDIEKEFNPLPFLWLLFHEFRHHVQFNDSNIISCLDNKNRDMWLNHYDYTLNSVKHVFHEIDPLEIDANTFACEILDIPYPNSKFSITKKTLKRLEPKNRNDA